MVTELYAQLERDEKIHNAFTLANTDSIIRGPLLIVDAERLGLLTEIGEAGYAGDVTSWSDILDDDGVGVRI